MFKSNYDGADDVSMIVAKIFQNINQIFIPNVISFSFAAHEVGCNNSIVYL